MNQLKIENWHLAALIHSSQTYLEEMLHKSYAASLTSRLLLSLFHKHGDPLFLHVNTNHDVKYNICAMNDSNCQDNSHNQKSTMIFVGCE